MARGFAAGMRMKHKCRRHRVGQLQLADGLVRAVLIDQAIDHHLLLLGVNGPMPARIAAWSIISGVIFGGLD